MGKKIKLIPKSKRINKEPETFEEWVAIHGEPEYIEDVYKEYHDDFEYEILKNGEDFDIQPENPVDPSEVYIISPKGKLDINYINFVDYFIAENNLVFCNGNFYTPDGIVTNGKIRKDVIDSLGEAEFARPLDSMVNSIFNMLKDRCFIEKLPVSDNVIPFANGDLHVHKNKKWIFYEGYKRQAPYRLKAKFDNKAKRTKPLFDKWLRDTFHQDDIATIQEILGYCLIPNTSAQEAFFIVGDAGIGKSGLGAILENLWGNAFEPMETQSLVTGRFQLSKAENKLVVYDDDLGTAALTETSILKKLITSDQKIAAERKFLDPYSFKSYCKIIACTNIMLSSLYDDTDGFFRRLHPILVLPKNEKRKTIKNFYQMILKEESEAIIWWALKGLKRLQDNGFQISWSNRSKEYFNIIKGQSNHMNEFLDDTTELNARGNVTTAELKKLYSKWCNENAITPISERKFIRWLSDNENKRNMSSSRNIYRGSVRLRGYTNISIKNEWQSRIGLRNGR